MRVRAWLFLPGFTIGSCNNYFFKNPCTAVKSQIMDAFQIAAGWCVHQAGKTAIADELTNHSCERKRPFVMHPKLTCLH